MADATDANSGGIHHLAAQPRIVMVRSSVGNAMAGFLNTMHKRLHDFFDHEPRRDVYGASA
jgi:hypothetical protein